MPPNVFALSADRVLATARLALAAFSLIAIYFDPRQPAFHAEIAYGILVAYLAFALIVAFAAFFAQAPAVAKIVFHVVDIVTFSLVMRFTEGSTSPFFVLLTYALLSATVYWGWRGAMGTAVVLALLLVLIGWSEGSLLANSDAVIDDLIIRGSYLLVAGALLAYLGAYRDRARTGLAKLAVWPAEQNAPGDLPPLGRSLRHAADVMQASSVLVLWEDVEEPYVYGAFWTPQSQHTGRLTFAGLDDLLAPELMAHPFLMNDAAGAQATLASGTRQPSRSPLAAALRERFDLAGSMATAPFRGSGFNGRVFVMRPAFLGEETLSLIEITALRIGIEIEHHRLRIELQRAAALEERMRIARDLHDGTLQALTAAALRLKNDSETASSEQRARLDEVRKILSDQQGKLRAFVTEALERSPRDESVSLKDELGYVLHDIERDWGCETALKVEPASATVRDSLGDQLRLLITEAAANAVRHGQAKLIDVAVICGADKLSLRIGNDGRPLLGLAGRFDNQELARRNLGPVSIRNRVAMLRGYMMLSSSDAGVELAIELPVT